MSTANSPFRRMIRARSAASSRGDGVEYKATETMTRPEFSPESSTPPRPALSRVPPRLPQDRCQLIGRSIGRPRRPGAGLRPGPARGDRGGRALLRRSARAVRAVGRAHSAAVGAQYLGCLAARPAQSLGAEPASAAGGGDRRRTRGGRRVRARGRRGADRAPRDRSADPRSPLLRPQRRGRRQAPPRRRARGRPRLRRIRTNPGFARLVIDGGEQRTELDLAADARPFHSSRLRRRRPLSGEELAIDKVLAVFGRRRGTRLRRPGRRSSRSTASTRRGGAARSGRASRRRARSEAAVLLGCGRQSWFALDESTHAGSPPTASAGAGSRWHRSATRAQPERNEAGDLGPER